MTANKPQWGPLLAAIIFGIAYGVISLVTGKFWTGVNLLGVVFFLIALVLAPDAPAKLLVVALAALVCSGGFAYSAASSEFSGEAVHCHLGSGRSLIGEPVTRREWPAKFRQATNLKWGLSLLCAGIAVFTFMSRRSLDSMDPFEVGLDKQGSRKV